MTTSSEDPRRWHPAAGQGFPNDVEIVDLPTERAIRLLARAGMISPAAVAARRRPVR